MVVFIVLIFVIVPITNFLHELGHILIAKFYSVKGTMIVIGSGRKLFHFTLFNTKVFIHAVYFIGALSTNESQEKITNWQKGLISLGGPFLNIGIGTCIYFSGFYHNQFVLLFMLFNMWVGVLNVLPFKISKRESDGYVFVKSLLGR